jgi:hypothetical protein
MLLCRQRLSAHPECTSQSHAAQDRRRFGYRQSALVVLDGAIPQHGLREIINLQEVIADLQRRDVS